MSFTYHNISENSALHASLVEKIDARYRLSARRMERLHKRWKLSEEQFIAYAPEREVDALRRVKREEKGEPQYTTVILPYTYGMVMSSHSYISTVFLGRDPVFQYQGIHGEPESSVLAVEALIAYQLREGFIMPSLFIFLLDTLKYGFGVLGVCWEKEVKTITVMEEVEQTNLLGLVSEKVRQISTQEINGYEGNKTFNIRPYEYFPDPRVPIWNVQKGEFVGFTRESSWNEILSKVRSGAVPKANAERYREQVGRSAGERMQGSTSEFLDLPEASASSISEELSSSGPFTILTMYVDLIAKDWGLGEATYPEKWVFSCGMTSRTSYSSSGVHTVLEAHPLGAYHAQYPIVVGAIEPEGYTLTPRGIPDIVRSIQNSMDWLLNSHMYSVRKTMNNQFVVDPSRINMGDFALPQHGGTIRVKPSSFGQDVRTAIHQLQTVDLTVGHLRDMGLLDEAGQRATGVNEQLQGMLNVGGSRKTAQEVRTSSTFGVNRQKTGAEFLSALSFSPLSSLLLRNSQQYLSGETKLRIVGDIATQLPSMERFVTVDPGAIAGGFEFIPVDGTLPVDRFAQAMLWQQMLGSMVRFPQLLAQYDLGKIFGWVMQLAGLKNLSQFRVQVLPPDAGIPSNVVPLNQDILR